MPNWKLKETRLGKAWGDTKAARGEKGGDAEKAQGCGLGTDPVNEVHLALLVGFQRLHNDWTKAP